MQQLASQQKKVFDLELVDELSRGYKIQAREYMAFQLQMMKSLKLRAEANSTRLQGEISLV
jgi:hypothetical protein